jgi:hypothetical protein
MDYHGGQIRDFFDVIAGCSVGDYTDCSRSFSKINLSVACPLFCFFCVGDQKSLAVPFAVHCLFTSVSFSLLDGFSVFTVFSF